MKIRNGNIIYLFLVLGVFLLIGCNEISEKRFKSPVSRFEIDVARYGGFDSLQRDSFELKYKDLLPIFGISRYSVEVCDSIANTDIYRAFISDVSANFGCRDSLEYLFGSIEKKYCEMFPGKIFPQITTAILPYNQAVINVDKCSIVCLNHYLGESHKMYLFFDSYIRRYKDKNRLGIDFAESLVAGNLHKSENANLLSEMIYDGVLTSLTSELLPQNLHNSIYSFTEEEVKWIKRNSRKIWQTIVSKDILYSKSPVVIGGMLAPAPFCSEISQECPARVGRWIGHSIVMNYCRNLGLDITKCYEDILNSQPFVILQKSEYDGQ